MGLSLRSKRALYQLDSMAVWLSPDFGFGFAFAFAIVCTVQGSGEEQRGTGSTSKAARTVGTDDGVATLQLQY